MSWKCGKCGGKNHADHAECLFCLIDDRDKTIERLTADRDEWERLWKKASNAVIGLQDENERLHEAADEIERLKLLIKVQGETIKEHESEIDADKEHIAELHDANSVLQVEAAKASVDANITNNLQADNERLLNNCKLYIANNERLRAAIKQATEYGEVSFMGVNIPFKSFNALKAALQESKT